MKHLLLLLATLAILLAGCAGNRNPRTAGATKKQLEGRVPPKPKAPPAVPPRKDVPLDPQLASDARQVLLGAAQSKERTLRANALEAMREVPDDVSRQAILKALGDDEPIVRFSAAMAAGELKLADAKPALLSMVDDPNKNVQVAVRFALHKLGITDHSHDLEKFAQDPDPGVRGNTALVVGLLGEPSALRPGGILRTLRLDPQATVRQQASEAMWRLGDADAKDDLLALTVSAFADDQMIGVMALAGPRKSEVQKYVGGMLTSDYAEVSLVAARAMGMLGSDEGYGVALKGAKSGNKAQRFLAALAFGAIGRTDAQPALRNLLKDKDDRVRVAAAAAVLQLGKPADSASLAGAQSGKGG